MSEHQSRDALVRKLLEQEDRVSEDRYAEHRRRLDEKIALAHQPAQRFGLSALRGRILWGVAVVAAAGLLGVLVWRPWRADAPPSRPSQLVVLPYPPRSWAVGREKPAPYEEALSADLIATATPGTPVRSGGRLVVPLRLERVLKKPVGEQALPSFCCSLGNREPAPNYLAKDTRVLVYLTRHEEGDWGLLDVCPLTEQSETREVKAVERCLRVAGAAHSANPAAEYRRLLAPEAGGLDAAACTALYCCPDPRAARPVADCARRLPRGQRGPAFSRLPELCQSADAPTRAAVRALLIEEIEAADPDPADYSRAAHALGRLADRRAVAVLIRQQQKRPITARNADAARALKEAGAALGPGGRELVRDAWLQLLRAYQPLPRPTAAPPETERALVAEVVRLVRESGLNEAQKKQVREIRDHHAELWFKQALEPLSK